MVPTYQQNTAIPPAGGTMQQVSMQMPAAQQNAQEIPISKSNSGSSSTVWMLISIMLTVCLVVVCIVGGKRGAFKPVANKPIGDLKHEFNVQTIDDLAAIDEESFRANVKTWFEKNHHARLGAVVMDMKQEYDNMPELKSIPNEGVIQDMEKEMEQRVESMGKEITEVHLPQAMAMTGTTTTDLEEVPVKLMTAQALFWSDPTIMQDLGISQDVHDIVEGVTAAMKLEEIADTAMNNFLSNPGNIFWKLNLNEADLEQIGKVANTLTQLSTITIQRLGEEMEKLADEAEITVNNDILAVLRPQERARKRYTLDMLKEAATIVLKSEVVGGAVKKLGQDIHDGAETTENKERIQQLENLIGLLTAEKTRKSIQQANQNTTTVR